MENPLNFETLYLPNTKNPLHNVKIEQKDQNDVMKFLYKHGINIENSSICIEIRPFKCSFCEVRFGFYTDLEYELMGHFKENHLDRIIKIEPQIDISNNTEFVNDALQQEELPPETEDLQNEEEQNAEVLSNSKNKFECTICYATYYSTELLEKHMSMGIHEVAKIYKCDECPLKFKRRGALNEHKAIHKPPEFECDECHKQFTWFKVLSKHKLSVHGIKMQGKKDYMKNKEAQPKALETVEIETTPTETYFKQENLSNDESMNEQQASYALLYDSLVEDTDSYKVDFMQEHNLQKSKLEIFLTFYI